MLENLSPVCVSRDKVSLPLRIDSPGLTPLDATLVLTVEFSEPNTTAMLACFPNQATFSVEGGKLYAGFLAEGSWSYHLMSGAVPLTDGKRHQVAMTIHHHHVESQGEDWMEMHIFLDGGAVGGIVYDRIQPDQGEDALVLGEGKNVFGQHEKFAGAVLDYAFYDRALTDSAIKDLVLADDTLTPAFFVPAPLPAEFSDLLGQCPTALRPACAPFLQNLLPFPATAAKLQGALQQGQILALDGPSTTLFLADMPEFGGIVSWYDRRAQRQMLAPDNTFFTFTCRHQGQTISLNPCLPSATCQFTEEPHQDADGTWRFTFQTMFAPSPELPVPPLAVWACTFAQDRLTYTLELVNQTADVELDLCTYPALRLNPINGGDVMLAPAMCGVEYPEAAKRNASYTSWYPRGNASLQLGAYYDASGRGVCCLCEDRLARGKELDYHCGTDACSLNFTWTVARELDGEANNFRPGCCVSLNLIEGGWHECGLKYREMLHRIDAMWWNEHRTAVDNVKWLWENTMWFRIDLSGRELGQLSPQLIQLRQWLGLPFALHVYDWYERGSWLSPMVNAAPDMIEDVRELRKHGIRTVPYTTARIWQNPDVHGKDCNYTKIAVPAAVQEEAGNIAIEQYGLPCAVLCPQTESYQKWEYRLCVKTAALGFDGVYADQIGAARPRFCWNPNHGHKIADDRAWFERGQYPIYKRVRDHWKEVSPEMVLTTEDNAEHCVDLFHGLLNWRWMNDGQIPLFCEVYAGKTQFVGLDSVGEEDEAAFAKLATQLTNGEQLGWFQHQKVLTPEKHVFRLFLKQLMHLRFALLEFFNGGIMAPPPRFTPAQKRISLVWGRQGTIRVSSAPVLVSGWEKDGEYMAIFVNWTDKPQTVTCAARASFSFEGREVLVFMADGETAKRQVTDQLLLTLTIPARGSAVAITPGSALAPLRQAYSTIRLSAQAPDPFAVTADKLPAGPVRNTLGDWNDADADYLRIPGLGEEFRYFGEYEFSGESLTLEAEVSAPVEHPIGQMEFRLDDLEPENVLAVLDVASPFEKQIRFSDVPHRIITAQLPALQGRHKIIFTTGHCSHCEFTRWRIVKH